MANRPMFFLRHRCLPADRRAAQRRWRQLLHLYRLNHDHQRWLAFVCRFSASREDLTFKQLTGHRRLKRGRADHCSVLPAASPAAAPIRSPPRRSGRAVVEDPPRAASGCCGGHVRRRSRRMNDDQDYHNAPAGSFSFEDHNKKALTTKLHRLDQPATPSHDRRTPTSESVFFFVRKPIR